MTVVGIVVVVLMEFRFGFIKDSPDFLHRWQTLAAGLIALLGAAWTVHTMQRKEREEQKRKQKAAKFPLGNALTEVCGYSREGMSYLVDLKERQGEFNKELSRETIEALKDVTEWFEGDESIAAGVIGPKYQLCRARSQSSVGRPKDEYRYEVICDFAELHALASRLFVLSRDEKKQIVTGEVSLQEIFSAVGIEGEKLLQWYEQKSVREYVTRTYEDKVR